MKKNKSPIPLYTEAAEKLGLHTELVQSSPVKKRLLISNDEKFCLVSTGNPGFFPEATRWVAHFTSSKRITQQILTQFGYNVIQTKAIKVADYTSLQTLYQHLSETLKQLPLLLKPDRGYDGIGIEILDNAQQLQKSVHSLYKNKKDFLIQPILNQSEYRILVINGEVMLMHSKNKQGVVGDGTSTITQLLSKVKEATKDATYIQWQHKKLGTTPATILPKSSFFEYHLIKLPSNQYYKTTDFPPAAKKWAEGLAHTISSAVVGIDVFIPENFDEIDSYTIIELNTNPALYYLPKRCDDDVTAPRIIEKVLRDFFKLP